MPGAFVIVPKFCGACRPATQNVVSGVDGVSQPTLHSTDDQPGAPQPVNKHDLIAAVAASTNLSKTDAAGAIEATLTVITKSLKKKEKVLLVGFGTFQVSKRKAGEGRNPQTGEKIKIAAANVPRFRASKQLRDAIN